MNCLCIFFSNNIMRLEKKFSLINFLLLGGGRGLHGLGRGQGRADDEFFFNGTGRQIKGDFSNRMGLHMKGDFSKWGGK